MLKNELIKSVAADTKIPQDTVRQVMECIADKALSSIRGGEDFMLLGLGKLTVSHRGPKAARNIWTGESVTVPARAVPVFRPSVALSRAAQGK